MWLQQVRVCVCVCVCVWLQQAFVCTGWWRLIGSPKLQIIFHERATKYRSLLRKITYKDKGSYESSPPCSLVPLLEEYPCLRVYGTQIHEVLSSRGFWVFVGIHTCTCPYTCFTSVYIHIHTCVCVCVCVCVRARVCVYAHVSEYTISQIWAMQTNTVKRTLSTTTTKNGSRKISTKNGVISLLSFQKSRNSVPHFLRISFCICMYLHTNTKRNTQKR